MPFSFSHRKATQALNFFACKAGGSINKMKALKLVYFADRFHLRKYGRPVVGDEYLAMNYGPVASGTKDLAEMSDFLGEEEGRYAKRFIRPAESAITYASVHDVDEKVLSESDREALEFAWKQFGHVTQFALSKLTHRYPDWKKHEPALAAKTASRVPMNYRDFLEDPKGNADPCFELGDKDREAIASGIDDLAAFEKLWR
ncbi:MAG TPA: Panacea domain-containing protein [Chthoniobacterales bacterium]|nr:Panacea domain-containing protein [Chthoniobacterales bacterium]